MFVLGQFSEWSEKFTDAPLCDPALDSGCLSSGREDWGA